MVSVWDSAPCCQTRHPSSVAISIFDFIPLSPVWLCFTFIMLNMSPEIFGTPGHFWRSLLLVASTAREESFVPASGLFWKRVVRAGGLEMKVVAYMCFGFSGCWHRSIRDAETKTHRSEE